MKLTRLLSTLAAVGLSAVALPAAAVDYFFDATDVGAYGAPTYGTVSLTDNGLGGVLFKVQLDPEFNFVDTGNHALFSFNGTGVSLGDISGISVVGPQTFTATSTSVQNPPFGTFQFGIHCATSCPNGGSGGGMADPLMFTVANATIGDFLVQSTSAGDLGAAYFAADVIWSVGRQTATGAVGVTQVTTPVPEPETYALFLAGLGAVGFTARRRRKAA
jgi:hypothetical protein